MNSELINSIWQHSFEFHTFINSEISIFLFPTIFQLSIRALFKFYTLTNSEIFWIIRILKFSIIALFQFYAYKFKNINFLYSKHFEIQYNNNIWILHTYKFRNTSVNLLNSKHFEIQYNSNISILQTYKFSIIAIV